LRLIPLDPSLPKLRMRGYSIRNVLKWFREQDIDYSKYRADFVPHPKTHLWSSIFIVNSKGVFGEVIRGGHQQLTQGFYEGKKPITFSFDFSNWKFSESNEGAEEHAREILAGIKVEDNDKKNLIKERVDGEFVGDYLQGYFESVKSEEQGLWFIDYNRILGNLYDEFLPVIDHAGSENVVSGQVASVGKVSGRVRIVADEDVEKVNLSLDEILVCDMTTPEYFNIMQQAGGVITNSGGALSHAGIVAREMGKPCIVGTDNATEVLQEGEMIELDAENGVVRRL